VKYVARENELEYNKDVKLQMLTPHSSSYMDFLDGNNKTKFGIIFCLDYLDYLNYSLPCSKRYSNSKMHIYNIFYNISLPLFIGFESESPLRNDPQVVKLKIDIDNGYLDYYAKKNKITPPKVSPQLSFFPVIKDRFKENVDIFYDTGCYFFYVPAIGTLISIMLDIVREKEKGLRRSLIIIGLKNSSFWLSWFVMSVIYAVLITLIIIIAGKICEFNYFVYCSFFVNFILFFLYSLSMQIFGYFLTTIINSTKTAYGATFTIIVFGFLVQVIFAFYYNLQVLYVVKPEFWIYIVRFVLNLFPPFHFVKSFKDIASTSAGYIDWDKERWVKVLYYNIGKRIHNA
jgi:hypothetical protein